MEHFIKMYRVERGAGFFRSRVGPSLIYIRSKRRTSSSRPSIVAHKAHSDGLDERRIDAISFDEKAMARYEDDARRFQGHEGPEGHEGREAQAGRKDDGHKSNATYA